MIGYFIVAAIIFFAWVFWQSKKDEDAPKISEMGCLFWIVAIIAISLIALSFKLCSDDTSSDRYYDDPSEWIRHS